MSRCGSCPIYDRKRYGIRCDGDHGVEECADKLQELYYAMRADGPIEKALEDWGLRLPVSTPCSAAANCWQVWLKKPRSWLRPR